MMIRRFLCCLTTAILMLAALPAAADDTAARFDFYVLSLSWSPTYCASPKGKDSKEQCGPEKKFAFIVHGLWPQNENDYPQSCATTEPRRVPETLGRAYFDIMPSMGLIGHEWRKHGSCSGLGQKAYFDKTRAAFEKIRLPADIVTATTAQTFTADQIEQSFIRDNPGLGASSIAVSCERNQLEEVRICMSKDLAFRPCAEVDRKGCSLNRITVPPAR
ncbi:ribonuclease T2 [Rhizobium sp. RU35A]|uniref:ribonuclease T2 family protein n=1 Tax=Rhizobium sp. RU35A TaxID=1907414 RepID=UPI0009544B79|nr:ribonuclease T2 [Rhizobium sp. RU35A]